MSFIESRPAIYEDLLALPENIVGEILSGRLVTHRRAAPKYTLAYSALGATLGRFFDDPSNGSDSWWIFDAPELHWDPDILVPDITGWRRSRMPKLPETAWFELPPDWVCEILSPSTARVAAPRNSPSTRTTASCTPGWSTPISARSKSSRIAKASGCC